MAFHPYLFFVGDCRAAFTRYHEIFGGDVQILDMSSTPEDQRPPDVDPNSVMHAALMVGDSLLMGSDDPTASERTPVSGVVITWSAADLAETNRILAGLAEGGTVTQPVIETFFSPGFGMVTDRFGVPWMLTTDAAT